MCSNLAWVVGSSTSHVVVEMMSDMAPELHTWLEDDKDIADRERELHDQLQWLSAQHHEEYNKQRFSRLDHEMETHIAVALTPNRVTLVNVS